MTANANNNWKKRQRSKGLLEASLTAWNIHRVPSPDGHYWNYSDRPVAKVHESLADKQWLSRKNEHTGNNEIVVPISYWKNAYDALYTNNYVGRKEARVILAVHSPVEIIGSIKSSLFQADFVGHERGEYKKTYWKKYWCLVTNSGPYRRSSVHYYAWPFYNLALANAKAIDLGAVQTALLIQTGHREPDPPF